MFVVRSPRTKQQAVAGASGFLLFAAIALCSLCYVAWNGSATCSGPVGDQRPCSKTNDANVSASSRENQKLNQRLEPLPRMPASFQEAVNWIVSARKERDETATLVQIGANDGQMFDPFYELYGEGRLDEWHSDWTALLVEPQPELNSRAATFHATSAALESSAWRFYPGAVAGPDRCRNGTIEFCETRTPGVGDWRTQGQTNTVDAARCEGKSHMQLIKRPCVASFSELLEHASPRFREVAFNEHLRSYNLDFLLIDTEYTEGADFSILLLIDWNVLKPYCIRYEQHVMYRKDKVVQDLIGQGGGNADGDGANDNGDGDGTNADAALDAAVVELDAAVADADAAKRVELEALAAAKRAELAALAAAARELLESKGYTTVDQGMDTMACLVESDSESSPKKFTVGDRVEGDWQMEGLLKIFRIAHRSIPQFMSAHPSAELQPNRPLSDIAAVIRRVSLSLHPCILRLWHIHIRIVPHYNSFAVVSIIPLLTPQLAVHFHRNIRRPRISRSFDLCQLFPKWFLQLPGAQSILALCVGPSEAGSAPDHFKIQEPCMGPYSCQTKDNTARAFTQ